MPLTFLIRQVLWLGLCFATLNLQAADAISWRKDGSGRFPGVEHPPLHWNLESGESVLWTTAIPSHAAQAGWPTGTNANPLVVGEQVFTMAEPNWIYCINLSNGAIKWKKAVGAELFDDPADLHQRSGHKWYETIGNTSPTPVWDGESLYVQTDRGVIAKFKSDGTCLWAVSNPESKNKASSPCHADDALIVGPHGDASWLVIESKDGSVRHRVSVAKDKRRGSCGSLQSIEINGKTYVIAAEGFVLDPAAGLVVQDLLPTGWTNRGMTPVIYDGIVYISAYNMARECTLFSIPIQTGGVPTEPLWRLDKSNRFCQKASPLATEKFLFVPGGSKCQFMVLDRQSGSILHRLPITTGYLSPALAGPYLYAFAKREVFIYHLDDFQNPVARFPHGLKAATKVQPACNPYFTDNKLIFRDSTGLHCMSRTP